MRRFAAKQHRIILSALLLLLPYGCGRHPKPPPAPPSMPVVTAVATSENVPVYRDYPAKCLSPNPVSIVPRVSGWIREQHFCNGQLVTAGQPLYLIDPDPFIVKVAYATAELASAKAAAFNALQEYERAQALRAVEAVSEQEKESLEASYLEAQAKVEASAAALALAELNLSYCNVISPVSGQTSATTKYVGDLVGPETAALTTVQPQDPLWVQFMAVSDDLPALRQQLAEAHPSVSVALPNKSWQQFAKIIFIDNQVIANSDMVQVRVEVHNQQQQLLPGMYLNATVQTALLKDAVVVPIEAVLRKNSQSIVWLLQQDGTAAIQTVTVGPTYGSKVVITEGLKAGQSVIVQGQGKLKPGAKVKILSPSKAKQGAS